MKILNYANIFCPTSGDPIYACSCQNCVIARMEEDYKLWLDLEARKRANFMLALGLFILIASVTWKLAAR